MATFEGEDLRDARFVDCQLDGAEFREVTLVGARFIGSVLINVEIDALVQNLTVNGVDVVPLVEAELDRRHPERLALRPTDLEGASKALDVVDAFWAPTIEVVRSLPEDARHQRVAGEWSVVETLRHLLFVYDAWFGRAVLGEAKPYHPLGLPASFLDSEDFGLETVLSLDPWKATGCATPERRAGGVADARKTARYSVATAPCHHTPPVSLATAPLHGSRLRPDLDQVLTTRKARQDLLRAHLATMDDQILGQPVSTHGIAGFPPEEERSPWSACA